MERFRAHPVAVTLLAIAIAAAAAVAIAAGAGFASFARVWAHLNTAWLALGIGAQLLAIPAYGVSYRVVARFDGGPRLPLPLLARIVISGFGPSAAGGGFALDRRALRSLHLADESATLRVLGLGALEWAVLAPAACISAAVLLWFGDHRAMPSLLWSWVIGVPLGFGIGFWAAGSPRRCWLAERSGRAPAALARALNGVAVVASLAQGVQRCWQAWLGVVLYWALDIISFYACARFIGLRLGPGEIIVSYATGYALTRRTMPLGGAGITEGLMTLALHWVGVSFAPALAVVLVYRGLNFLLPALPALAVRPRIYPLVQAATEGRAATRIERHRAGASW
jgi:uncharacterized membrane protein YbhN (UPF0104 family)